MGKTKTDTTHIAKASARNLRVPPRKARLVVDMIRGRSLDEAVECLEFCDKKTAAILKKLLLSAAANASDLHSIESEELFVKRAWVDEGRALKRFLPRAQGRATRLRRRSSHINVVLDELAS